MATQITHHWRANTPNNKSNARTWNPFEKHIPGTIFNWNTIVLNPYISVVDVNIFSRDVNTVGIESGQVEESVFL